MWIQFNNAFLSIVENRDNKLELLVRARIKGDIEKIFPEVEVFENDSADYKYRALISKAKVAARMMLKITEILIFKITYYIYLHYAEYGDGAHGELNGKVMFLLLKELRKKVFMTYFLRCLINIKTLILV